MKTDDFCDMHLRDDGIVQIRLHANIDVKVEHVQSMVNRVLELTNGKKALILMYLGAFSTFSQEARAFSANPQKEIATSAIAYIVDNLGHRIVLNFFIRINKPIKPIKMFSDEDNAVTWLLNQSN